MFTIDKLAAIPLFSTLGEKELEYLAGAVEDINLTAGDYLGQQGPPQTCKRLLHGVGSDLMLLRSKCV